MSGASEAVRLGMGRTGIDADAAARTFASDDFLAKLWRRDASPWTDDPKAAAIVEGALGWLTFPATVRENAAGLAAFAREAAAEFDHAVVLGMGGSSLAPDVLRATFGAVAGFPALLVLDSSDPAQIRTLEARLDLARTLFIVSSKSGTTTEPEAFYRYFWGRVEAAVGAGNAGRRFVAITDPGTLLEGQATEAGFRRIFRNDPAIGGRYSALSYFGMVPAAIAGYDAATLLDRGLAVLAESGASADPAACPGVRFGAAIGTLAKAGHNKLTIVTHPTVAAFGTWAEQLIAESTGKLGTGIVPIEGEPLGEPGVYGGDRVFVYVGAGLPGGAESDALEAGLAALEAQGHPVVRLAMRDALDVGAQFALWEIAVAAAGSVLRINAFDQPNVQESKDNTKRLLEGYAATHAFAQPRTALETPAGAVIPLAGSAADDFGADLASAVAAVIAQVRPGDYVAFTAYVERDEEHERRLGAIRTIVRDALAVATTVGFGPRFLHSTGQLHKGGPDTGVFFQLTASTPRDRDLAIPVMATTFATLIEAQWLGDFESLDSRKRRGVRVHLAEDVDTSLDAFAAALRDAVATRV